MQRYKISLTKTAQKQLDKLPNSVAMPIIEAIEKLATNPRPSGCKKLKGRDGYRIRKGDYRIIYDIYDEELVIDVIALGHRKEIYE
jgi:mRNA interferase RelE/StbE